MMPIDAIPQGIKDDIVCVISCSSDEETSEDCSTLFPFSYDSQEDKLEVKSQGQITHSTTPDKDMTLQEKVSILVYFLPR
jgi:hypothetical protein